MSTIHFTVYGDPVAQGRPRAANIAGHIRMYDPKKSRDYKDYVRLAASEHAPAKLLDGPLYLEVKIFRPMPKAFSRKKAAEAENGRIRPTTKPDADNYLKGVKDALKSVIWEDDSQVVTVTASKWYSARPRVEIKVSGFQIGEIDQEKPAQAALF